MLEVINLNTEFSIQHRLKQGATSPSVFNFALEYITMKVQEYQD
jgi:hypothetical protein